MGKNIYSEIRPDLRYIADYLEEHDIKYSIYNYGIQYNAVSLDGAVHSFYPTTGTIVLHPSDPKKRQNRTFRNRTKEDFLYFLQHPEIVQQYFK